MMLTGCRGWIAFWAEHLVEGLDVNACSLRQRWKADRCVDKVAQDLATLKLLRREERFDGVA